MMSPFDDFLLRKKRIRFNFNLTGNTVLLFWFHDTPRLFSHDVTAATLVYQNNETAATLVYQTNLHGCWPRE